MARPKYFLLLLLATFVCGKDEYHPKPQLEFANIHPIFKGVEGHNIFWNEGARRHIESKLNTRENIRTAKNVIMFIGDGLSIGTTVATRMYLGGEELNLSYEEFPHYGLGRSYCVDRQVPDSGCAATALLSGIKNNYRGLGLTANVSTSQCNFRQEDVTFSIAKWAQDAGKATGVVTTTRVTHATPAALYAHSPHRDWENNDKIPLACRNTDIADIAHQLVYNEEGEKLKVILGCGTKHFLNTTMQNEEGQFGERTDGRNLIDEWLVERNKVGNAQYVSHKQQLDFVDIENTDYLFGMFEHDHCMYRLDILNNQLENQEPLLTQMTETAIKMLQKDDNGFFLMVEGGRIDHAHHSNYARVALDETAEFARAIELARLMTSEEDTLIVVASDHSHVFTISGYSQRHNDILRLVTNSTLDDKPYVQSSDANAGDGKPYETLSYANGPGYASTFGANGERVDMANDDFTRVNRTHSATVPLPRETHAGEDAAIYAIGPWSHLFGGSFEQNIVPIAMAYAMRVGPYAERAERDNATPQ